MPDPDLYEQAYYDPHVTLIRLTDGREVLSHAKGTFPADCAEFYSAIYRWSAPTLRQKRTHDEIEAEWEKAGRPRQTVMDLPRKGR